MTCGDQTYWIVTKSHNPHIKQIKSLIDNKCLGFMGREFGMQDYTQDDSSTSLNGWGDKNLSPLQRQYFALLGGFHGSTSQGEAAEKIRLHGIINLGAWVAKISELP